MKKLILCTLLLGLSVSSSFALTIGAEGTSLGGGVYKPSANVSVVVFTDAAGTQYAAGSANSKGKLEFATNSSDPRIYSQTAATAGTPSVSADTWTASGDWTAK